MNLCTYYLYFGSFFFLVIDVTVTSVVVDQLVSIKKKPYWKLSLKKQLDFKLKTSRVQVVILYMGNFFFHTKLFQTLNNLI